MPLLCLHTNCVQHKVLIHSEFPVFNQHQLVVMSQTVTQTASKHNRRSEINQQHALRPDAIFRSEQPQSAGRCSAFELQAPVCFELLVTEAQTLQF